MRNSFRCLDANCRNFNKRTNADFCPACKGEIALKYMKPRANGLVKDWRFLVKITDAKLSGIDLTTMYTKSQRTPIETFIQYIPLEYLNAMFGYKNTWDGENSFRHNNKRMYKSMFQGNMVFWIRRKEDGKDQDYVFANKHAKFNLTPLPEFVNLEAKPIAEMPILPSATAGECDR